MDRLWCTGRLPLVLATFGLMFVGRTVAAQGPTLAAANPTVESQAAEHPTRGHSPTKNATGQDKIAAVRAMEMDAELAGDKDATREATTEDVLALVREINRSREKTTSTRAGNLNGVRRAERGFNANCYLGRDGERIPVTQDWTAR